MQLVAQEGSTDPHLPRITTSLITLQNSHAALSLEDEDSTAAYLTALSEAARLVPVEFARPYITIPRKHQNRPVTTLARFVFDLFTFIAIPDEIYDVIVLVYDRKVACGAMVLATSLAERASVLQAIDIGSKLDRDHPHFLFTYAVPDPQEQYKAFLRGIVVTRDSSTVYTVLFQALANITARSNMHGSIASLRQRQKQVLQVYCDFLKPWCPKFVEVGIILPLLSLCCDDDKKTMLENYVHQQKKFICRHCKVFFPDLRKGYCSSACVSKDPEAIVQSFRKLVNKYRCRLCNSPRSLLVPYCSETCWEKNVMKPQESDVVQ